MDCDLYEIRKLLSDVFCPNSIPRPYSKHHNKFTIKEAIMKSRNRFFKTILMGALIVMIAVSGGRMVSAESNVLDGKTYIGPIGPKGKETDGEDELIFKDGKLFSLGCAEWGFGEGVYSARIEGDTIHFEAETISLKHGKIAWKGRVDGDRIESIYIWTKKRWYWKDAHEENWFKGTLQK